MNRAIENIKAYASGRSIVVAVSGGVDSMCLLRLIVQTGGFSRLGVCHIDHQLRAESAAEAELVGRAAAEVGAEFFPFVIELPDVGVELAARNARREIYQHLRREQGFELVALGHHARDQVETVLFRIFRSTAIRGLVGMPVLADDGLFRPMITTPKAEIDRFAREQGLEFATDKSNFLDDYDRNFIRNQILPLVDQRWKIEQAIETLCRTASVNEEYFDAVLDRSVVQKSGETVSIRLSAGQGQGSVEFGKLELAKKCRYAALALETAGLTPSSALIDRIVGLCDSQNGKRIEEGDWSISRAYDRIIIQKKATKNVQTLPFAVGRTIFGDSIITVERGKRQGCLWMDVGKIPPTAVFRTRREGDTFQPFGGGTRKLKEYLIDKKIPQAQRDSLVLIANGSTILAILEVEISDTLKQTPTSNPENIFWAKVEGGGEA